MSVNPADVEVSYPTLQRSLGPEPEVSSRNLLWVRRHQLASTEPRAGARGEEGAGAYNDVHRYLLQRSLGPEPEVSCSAERALSDDVLRASTEPRAGARGELLGFGEGKVCVLVTLQRSLGPEPEVSIMKFSGVHLRSQLQRSLGPEPEVR